MPIAAFLFVLVGAAYLIVHGAARSRMEDRVDALRIEPSASSASVGGLGRRLMGFGSGRGVRVMATIGGGAAVGLRVAGIPGLILGMAIGAVGNRTLERRKLAARERALEHQLADLVDACGMAVRGGASVVQALDVAAREIDEPMASLVGRVVSEQRLGTPFETALGHLTSALGSEDARLFALVMTIHHRSGGNVARPLEEVATTIRHRLAVRRELRALTAQGRISGAVLGVLPVGFFLILSATAHQQLAPIYRSAAGGGMVIAGLLLEGLAYLWIRQLLKVEV
jgi:tight adherence protein B